MWAQVKFWIRPRKGSAGGSKSDNFFLRVTPAKIWFHTVLFWLLPKTLVSAKAKRVQPLHLSFTLIKQTSTQNSKKLQSLAKLSKIIDCTLLDFQKPRADQNPKRYNRLERCHTYQIARNFSYNFWHFVYFWISRNSKIQKVIIGLKGLSPRRFQ